jgi:UDP-N-acetylmuramoyl-L-alanyl-D-glutamate--2,6-diaminopimelate ligase
VELAALLTELDLPAPLGPPSWPVPLIRAVAGDRSVTITSVVHDSRTVTPGSLFCCVRGTHVDGHDLAPAAVASGAVALLAERELPLPVTQLLVDDTRSAMGPVAAVFHGRPSESMDVIGVTGTNGKTTVTQLLGAIFEYVGSPTSVLGTLSGVRTTPEAPELQEWLDDRRREGSETVAMEVSSHALAMHRVNGVRFSTAVFTNLSRDHLDFHGSMDGYFAAKASLFRPEHAIGAVVNVDDPYGRVLRDMATIDVVGYSLADVTDLQLGPSSSRFTWRGHPVELALPGRFNVANALAAAETAVASAVDPAGVAAALSRPIVIPGRFERIDEGQPFTVVVDFAHTPDGLEQLLRSARELIDPARRVHVVFGCGGDRDATKRAPMGEVAAHLADRVVLTADNSRGEPTGAIIAAIREGYDRAVDRHATELVVEPDRRAAIGVAIAAAVPGDIVLIAGKGHEATQTVGDSVTPFDDRRVVAELLRATA